jgi:hypothetical protein
MSMLGQNQSGAQLAPLRFLTTRALVLGVSDWFFQAFPLSHQMMSRTSDYIRFVGADGKS